MSKDPRQANLNVLDYMPSAMRMPLPPRPHFDPNEIDGYKRIPSPSVLSKLPPGRRLVKNWTLNSEFTESGAVLPLNQRLKFAFNRGWGGRFPGVFVDKNVKFHDNALVLSATRHWGTPPKEMFKWFRDHDINQRRHQGKPFFGGSFLRTKKTMTFGYTEICCKLSASAVTCAFWLKELGRPEREIDIFEYTAGRQKAGPRHTREKIHLMTVHQAPSRITNQHEMLNTYVAFDRDLTKEPYITSGCLWTEDMLYFFINDVCVRELKHNNLFGKDCKMHVQVDREIFNWIEDPSNDDCLEDFKIYYMRTWDLYVDHTSDRILV